MQISEPALCEIYSDNGDCQEMNFPMQDWESNHQVRISFIHIEDDHFQISEQSWDEFAGGERFSIWDLLVYSNL